MGKQKNSRIVPVSVPVPQQALFPDMFTEGQEKLLALADGTRTAEALAAALGLPPSEVEAMIDALARAGRLRPATVEEMTAALAVLPNHGRHEDAISLARHLLALRRGDIPTLTKLANLLEVTARPQDAAAQWQFISQIHAHEGRLGEALLAARKAAALQPLTHALQDALAELCLQAGRPAEAARAWCAYARRLADSGKQDAALAVLDYAQSKIPSDDMLMFTEAELLAVGAGHPRKPELPPRLLKKKSLNGAERFSWSACAAVAVLLAVLAAFALGVVEYCAREKQMTACEVAEKASAKLPGLTSARKATAAGEILAALRAAAPWAGWLETREYRAALRTAAAYRDKAEAELARQRAGQAAALERWRAGRSPENARVLGDLLLELMDDPASPVRPAAREEWRRWLDGGGAPKKVDGAARKADND